MFSLSLSLTPSLNIESFRFWPLWSISLTLLISFFLSAALENMAEEEVFQCSLRGRTAARFLSRLDMAHLQHSADPSQDEVSDFEGVAGRRWHRTRLIYQGHILAKNKTKKNIHTQTQTSMCLVPVAGHARLLSRSPNKRKKRHTLLLLLLFLLLLMLVVATVVVTNPKTRRCPSQDWNTTLVVATADPRWKMRSVW